VVAAAFIIGGVLILWAERREHKVCAESIDDITWRDALKVGFAQALSMIPGTSRSGATIIGGLFFGLSRRAATEFSFFLAIPTMFAATLYDVYKHKALFSSDDINLFTIGSTVSFLSAFLAVRGLIRFISRHDFSIFAWYRIIFGVLVLVSAQRGWVDWSNH
jgi:undecaprenyl-diphosphatase